MSTHRWLYGLYRRFTIAFLYSIAIVLVVQAIGFIWLYRFMSGTSDDVHQRGVAWTRGISADLAESFERSPLVDVAQRLTQLDGTKRIFVVLRDGRVFGPAPRGVPEAVLEAFGMPAGDHATQETSEIVISSFAKTWEKGIYCATMLKVQGRFYGAVGLVPRSAIERFGPLVSAAGIAVVVLAILFFSIVVVRPVRARLHDLQIAVRRLGRGELEARAEIGGADEISEVAQAFNSMADELQRRTTALETSDRLRRQLVADVSHELMTPLTAVLGHLETLSMDELQLKESERRTQLAVAMREARRLRRVIGDLLDTARYEAGGVQLDIEEIDTGAIFKQIALRHEQECRLRRVRFDTVVGDGAGAFEADPFRIEQAIENIVANAFRHTPDGGRIVLSAQQEGNVIAFEVSDSGPGIALEHLPHVFDRFYKASFARGLASPGTGLGLSIVKAIVTGHGGQISATSANGTGAVIRFELPFQGPATENTAHA